MLFRSGVHWCGVSVEFEKKTICVFDSKFKGSIKYVNSVFEYLKRVHLKIYEVHLPDQSAWRTSLSPAGVP